MVQTRNIIQVLFLTMALLYQAMVVFWLLGVSPGTLFTIAAAQMETFIQVHLINWLIRHRRARWIFVVLDFVIVLLLWHYIREIPSPPDSIEIRISLPDAASPANVTVVNAFENPTGSPSEDGARLLLNFAWGFALSIRSMLWSTIFIHGTLVVLNLWGVCEDDRPKKVAPDVEQAVPEVTTPPAGPAPEQEPQVPGNEATGVVYGLEPEQNKEMGVVAEKLGCTGNLGCVNQEGAADLSHSVV